jgi:beta-glucanase (GH16 family)
MSSERSPPVIFQTEQLSSSPVNLSEYTQIFTEEFNGSSLDRSRWKTSLPWGPDRIINAENQYFVNTFGNNAPAYDPFVFTGETLRITGIETPPELRQAANNQPYLSGVISTSDHFEMTYGYVEMNARVASGDGLLSTFFLFNQNFEGSSPEIDVLEYIGSTPNKAFQTYHYYDSNRARWATGEKQSTPTMESTSSENLSSGFHTYAVLWEPGFVVWYIDGQEVRRLSGARISDEPMNIIVQLVMGSEWIGSPAASAIPAVFEIDYIRAWQK